jgi:hypothetical protein
VRRDSRSTPRTAATAEPPIDRRFLGGLEHLDELSSHQKRILLATIAFLVKVS